MEFSTLFAPVLFGTLGVAAWVIGRRRQSGALMVIGVALVGFTWIIPAGAWTWAIGALLVGLAIRYGGA